MAGKTEGEKRSDRQPEEREGGFGEGKTRLGAVTSHHLRTARQYWRRRKNRLGESERSEGRGEKAPRKRLRSRSKPSGITVERERDSAYAATIGEKGAIERRGSENRGMRVRNWLEELRRCGRLFSSKKDEGMRKAHSTVGEGMSKGRKRGIKLRQVPSEKGELKNWQPGGGQNP